jgi:AcrR family transcriptional regulator
MLDAALAIISERGYADTRVADVAARSGVSPALVIYYYKTKDQLLTEAIRYHEDTQYAAGQARISSLPTATARLAEFVALTCRPTADPAPHYSWRLWLDSCAQATRNEAVASVRQKAHERWREVIAVLVSQGREAGEFRDVDPVTFASYLSALLDGLRVQLALDDPAVDATRAVELAMRFAAGQLGFTWTPAQPPEPRR